MLVVVPQPVFQQSRQLVGKAQGDRLDPGISAGMLVIGVGMPRMGMVMRLMMLVMLMMTVMTVAVVVVVVMIVVMIVVPHGAFAPPDMLVDPNPAHRPPVGSLYRRPSHAVNRLGFWPGPWRQGL
jgi:hypothetical protein